MKKRIIAIDKDDVLVELTNRLYEFHNEAYGTKLLVEEATTFDLSVIWQVPPDEVEKRINAFYESKYFKNLIPVTGAFEAIRKLSKENTLIVITSRSEHIAHLTEASLEEHFPGMFTAIYHAYHFAKGRDKKTKADICLEVGASVLIDDAFHNAEVAARVGIKTLLFRRPWNKSINDEELGKKGIIPITSWQEVVNVLSLK